MDAHTAGYVCGRSTDFLRHSRLPIEISLFFTPNSIQLVLHSKHFMRWTPGGLSSDVEDRRGQSGGGLGGGGLGIVGFLILLVISLVTGRNYIGAYFANNGGAHVQQQSAPRAVSPQEDRSAQLASFVLGDAQDTWTQILARENIRYPRAQLVLFRDYTQSGCGTAQSATGPFYCPADQKVYLDLGFWDELKRFGASGEFAQAYVIAHEIGHHVQNVLGIERKVRAMQHKIRRRATSYR